MTTPQGTTTYRLSRGTDAVLVDEEVWHALVGTVQAFDGPNLESTAEQLSIDASTARAVADVLLTREAFLRRNAPLHPRQRDALERAFTIARWMKAGPFLVSSPQPSSPPPHRVPKSPLATVESLKGRTVIVLAKPVSDLPPFDRACLRGPLFKYLKAEHVEGMLTRGCVRVGTLNDYRREEIHGDVVGDAGEGMRSTFDNTRLVLSDDPETQSEVFKQVIHFDRVVGGVVKDIAFAVQEECEDLFVYSLSGHFTRAGYTKFARSQYTACIRIDNPESFLRAISDALRVECERKGIALGEWSAAACVYDERAKHYSRSGTAHPALLKPFSDADDREVRSLWRATPSKELAPLTLECPAAARYCVLHDQLKRTRPS